MDANNIPACGFREEIDGTITWGDSWQPGPHAGPEPICIQYHLEDCGAWIPFSAWTKDEEFDICESCYKRQPSERADLKRCTNCGNGNVVTRKCIDMHDCDWIAKEETLYHHESGSGSGMPYVGVYAEPAKVPGRIWIADGMSVVGVSGETPLTDEMLLAMGYRRVHGPTPDPFAGGIEGDTFYDERTGERVPDDDGEYCCCCAEQFAPQRGDFVALDGYHLDEDESPGIYRPSDREWKSGEWVAPIPPNRRGDEKEICPSCAAQAIADFGVHGLASAWCADPDGMPSEHREALLDAVRERVDPWIAGYPEVRISKVHAWLVADLAPRLGLPVAEMHKLCDEAGYG